MTITEEQYKSEIAAKYKNVPCDFCGETPDDYALFQYSVKQLDGDYKIWELKVCGECRKITEVRERFLEYEKEVKTHKSPLESITFPDEIK